jgi:UDP-N-acetylmuramate: L-alanyl-gamma-D-glutamyl-meso-diaminopimelate ligase
VQAFNLQLAPPPAEFEIPSFKFHLNLVGELNVRNALAVVAVRQALRPEKPADPGRVRHVQGHQAPHGSRGIAGGVTVGGRFRPSSHGHPRNPRALRIKYPREKIWAVFEPRSNTTRRNVFQDELAGGLCRRERRRLSQVARLEQIGAAERLDPAQLMKDLTARQGRRVPADVDAIVRMSPKARRAAMSCASSATAASAASTAFKNGSSLVRK